MVNEKYYKDAFHEAFRKSCEAGNDGNVYTPEMLYALKEMAVHDVYPDGKFGDIDCEIWSMLRR